MFKFFTFDLSFNVLLQSVERYRSSFKRIFGDEIFLCIDYICKEFCVIVGVLGVVLDVFQEVFNYVVVQVDLFFCFVRYVDGEMFLFICFIILKICSFGLKGLRELTLFVVDIKLIIRFLFMLFFLVVKFSFFSILIFSIIDK